jgi:hypothetical protein
MYTYTAENFVPSFTEANLAIINAAIATGATQVQYGDKMVTYRSLSDLLRLRTLMINEITGGNRVSFGNRTVGIFHSTKTV